MRKGSVLAAVAATLATLFFISTASAQYPEPRGHMVCVVNQINVSIHGSARIGVTMRDTRGSAMTDREVRFWILSQPDGSSWLSGYKAWTDGSGSAFVTLNAGSRAGHIVVVAESDDGMECSVLTAVFAPPPVEIIQRVESVVRPPATGDAGLAAIDTGELLPADLPRGLVVFGLAIGVVFLGSAVIALGAGGRNDL